MFSLLHFENKTTWISRSANARRQESVDAEELVTSDPRCLGMPEVHH
jgi:hypothetical protein